MKINSTDELEIMEEIPYATVVEIMDDRKDSSLNKNKPKTAVKKEMKSASAPKHPTLPVVVSQAAGKVWPAALSQAVIRNFKRRVAEEETRRLLHGVHGWPQGLVSTFIKGCKKIPIRFFVVDDSGSMSTNDGKRIVHSGQISKIISCTRWAELSDSLKFHATLAETAQVPTEFRLLNGADPVMVGLGDDMGEGLKFAMEVFDEAPAGQTPLCEHISCVIAAIRSLEADLRANNQKAAVIIATDGESTDGSVADAMRPLQHLPVVVIIRLCTDSAKIVSYWDEIDKELELEMDVLDDLVAESKSVAETNGWITYGDALHKLREFGSPLKEMDHIDEGPLGSEEMLRLIDNIFNTGPIPHPELDFAGFRDGVRRAVDQEAKIFDPITGTARPWINLDHLCRRFGGGSTTGGASTCVLS